jgi:transcriptional regulator of arginine metabolism
VVLKTYSGLAQAVAVGIDSMNLQTVLGCVAGDDTIMIVARDEDSASDIDDHIRRLMRDF